MGNNYLLEFKDICKRFPGVRALSNVSLGIRKGEIHALMGANGAGKSTLIKILARVYSQDGGEILLDGKDISRATTETIRDLGVEFIFQELELVQDFSAAQNILIGVEPTKGLVIDRNRMLREAQAAMDAFMPETVDVSSSVSSLSVAKQQMVCIVRALYRDPKILVLDEPTSRLSATETESLFAAIRRLRRERGITVIYISHRMEDIYAICDRVSILRDGEMVGSYALEELSRQDIVYKMVGEDIASPSRGRVAGARAQEGKPKLSVAGLCLERHLRDVSFDVYPGEVFVLTGSVGSQKTELIESIIGIRKADRGTVRIDGKEVRLQGAGSAKSAGICLVPEDRRRNGVIYDFAVRSNSSLAFLSRWTGALGAISRKREKADTEKMADFLSIKTASVETLVKTLSGGNQQKVVIAKWLLGDSTVYFFDEPTVGIDVKGKSEIYEIIKTLSSQGKAIVVATSDIEEAMRIGDRIAVMFEGGIQGIVDSDEADKQRMTYLAMGGRQ